MNQLKKQFDKLAYLLLFLGFVIGAIAVYISQFNATRQFVVILLMVAYYLIWGFSFHHLKGNASRKLMLEYLLVASNTQITGDAFAVLTISSPDPTINGSSNQNQQAMDMPEFDEQEWKDQANINNNPHIGDLKIESGSNVLGPKKILGDLVLESNSSLNLTGPVHVIGNFIMESNSQLKLNKSFGSIGTVLITDGMIQLNSNAQVISTDTKPKGHIILVSTKDTDTAIELNSNSNASIIYALNGTIEINSNSQVVSIAANKLILNSNASLTYQEGLTSSYFSSGPGGSWQFKRGTYKYSR